MTYPQSETLTKEEWEARFKMESAGRAWLVNRGNGVVYPGAYIPDVGFFFARPYGYMMIPPDKVKDGGPEFEIICGPRFKNELVPKDVHDAIMQCLPAGIAPKAYTE